MVRRPRSSSKSVSVVLVGKSGQVSAGGRPNRPVLVFVRVGSAGESTW